MKKVMNLFIAAIMLAAIGSASVAAAQEWTDKQKEVWAVVADGWDKWQKGDVEGSMADFHDKYMGWNQDDPLPTSKSKLAKNWKMMAEMMTVDWYDIEPARITVYNDVAVVNYYFEMYTTMTWGEKKMERHSHGKNTEFYLKEKGKWMLIGDMTFFKEGGPGDEDDD